MSVQGINSPCAEARVEYLGVVFISVEQAGKPSSRAPYKSPYPQNLEYEHVELFMGHNKRMHRSLI